MSNLIAKDLTEQESSKRPNATSYNISTTQTLPKAPAFSFKGRLQNQQSSTSVPGVGSYNIDSQTNVSACSFHGKFGQHAASTVGPYNVNHSVVDKKTPCFSFGARTEPKVHQEYTPGPGSYSATVIKKQIGPSFGKRRTDQASQNPGPQDYHVEQLKSLKCGKIGEKVAQKQSEPTPGPGSYDLKSLNVSQATSFHQRFEDKDYTNAPGVGTYNLAQQKGVSHSIGNRPHEQVILPTPGPATYDQQETLKQNKAGSIHQKYGTPKQLGPGPATFNLQSHKSVTEGHGQSIGDKPNMLHNETTPGPGSYDVKPVNQNNALSFGQPIDIQTKQTPGPLDYQPVKDRNIIGGQIGQKLIPKPITLTPGPGQYNIIKGKQGGVSMRFRINHDMYQK